MLISRILFYFSSFIIFWAMIGYPLSLKILNKIFKSRKVIKDYSYQPTVTVMVVAHNEEKVILDKLKNIISIDYPRDKIEFVIASDNSTDQTNEIIKRFIAHHPNVKIRLFEVKARKGKTNAQNEAHKTINTEYLVMTDANSLMEKNAVRELMASFTSEDIAYVTGRLSIINKEISEVSNAEANYWNSDLKIREIESQMQTITAGNGAIYACRTNEYYDFHPIESHDSAMPTYYAINGKRAIANHDAIAYEKAGEIIEDEFGRKVRMNRVLLKHIIPDIRILNVFKYKWFSYFYFGHRTSRYLLWISHLILYITSLLLVDYSWIYSSAYIMQSIFFFLALSKVLLKSQNKVLMLIYYYAITVIAQWYGVINVLIGKSKPFWDKAESTR